MVTLPPAGYLQAAQELCRRYGTLFVARRDPDRARAHRQVVRARALGARAGLRARRQGAQRRLHAGRRDGHHAARSTSGPSGRSSAPTCTSRRSGATACRWPPAWRRCASSSATAWSSTPRASAALLLDGLAELQQRYEMIAEVRGQRADDRDRAGRAELARRPAELAPDPHGERGAVPAADRDPAASRPRRDHDGGRQERRDQAAAAADAVRGRGAAASSTRSTPCSPTARRRGQELGRRARHRHRDAPPPRSAERRRDDAGSRQAVDRARDDVCLVTGATGFIGGASRSGWCRRAIAVRCLVRASSDTSLLEGLDVEIAVGDLTERALARRAASGCRYVFHCGALVSDWATAEEIAAVNVAGHAEPARGVASARRCGASSTSARTDVYGYPGRRRDRRELRRDALSQLVRPDQARRRGRGPARSSRARRWTPSSCARRPSTARARPTSSARSRARSAAATCCSSTAVARSPGCATSTT